MLLQPNVEAVVDFLGQPGVLHPQFVLQFDGARVLLPQLVPHAARQDGLFVGQRPAVVQAVSPDAGVDELPVQTVLPKVQQLQLDVVRFALRVISLRINIDRKKRK